MAPAMYDFSMTQGSKKRRPAILPDEVCIGSYCLCQVILRALELGTKSNEYMGEVWII